MVIEIVGVDDQHKKRTSCRNCGSILEYFMSDTRRETVSDYGGGSDTYQRIDCPKCKNVINV